MTRPISVFALHGGGAARRGGPLTPFGCTYIRLLRPLAHPSLSARVRFEHGSEPPAAPIDVAIVERYWREETTVADAERVLRLLRSRAGTVLHTFDDDLLALNAERPWAPFPTAEVRRVVAFFAREADGLIVSTEALRERFGRLNPRVAVVPNALDEGLFGLPAAPGPAPRAESARRELVVGYMGTLTHDADLRLVLEPLRAALRRHRARLELVGVAGDRRLLSLFDGLSAEVRDPGPEHVYPSFVPWMRRSLAWDVAIAPLEETLFTSSKSDLKHLDYAALGVPGVYSDVRPYRESVRPGETGLLAANDPASWAAALDALLGSAERRRGIRESARALVQSTRTLATRAADWLAAVESLSAAPAAISRAR